MTRILSYNMLAGGYGLHKRGSGRIDELTRLIRSTQPDIVGLPEAINPRVPVRPMAIEKIADQLGMQFVSGYSAQHSLEFQVALLTRLPIIHTELHIRPGILTRPLLEVCVEEPGGRQLTVFVTHLIASFSQRRAADHTRQREVREIMNIMSRLSGTPHLLMGDFNALAPGDELRASALLRYVVNLDRTQPNREDGDGHPHLSYVIPERLHVFNPLLRHIPRSPLLMRLMDSAAALYAPRGSISLLRNSGYVDCFRKLHPDEQGFTCPAAAPAGRIDFIFASPELAGDLSQCSIVTAGGGVRGDEASDHLPVLAEFGEAQRVGRQENTSAEAASLVGI